MISARSPFSTILDKADNLSEEEWDTMKKHPEIGYHSLSTPELVPIARLFWRITSHGMAPVIPD